MILIAHQLGHSADPVVEIIRRLYVYASDRPHMNITAGDRPHMGVFASDRPHMNVTADDREG